MCWSPRSSMPQLQQQRHRCSSMLAMLWECREILYGFAFLAHIWLFCIHVLVAPAFTPHILACSDQLSAKIWPGVLTSGWGLLQNPAERLMEGSRDKIRTPSAQAKRKCFFPPVCGPMLCASQPSSLYVRDKALGCEDQTNSTWSLEGGTDDLHASRADPSSSSACAWNRRYRVNAC